MNIVFFSDSYRPYVSGVVRSIENYSCFLRKRGHRVYIFAPDYAGVDANEKNVFRFKSLPAVIYPSFRISLPFSLRILDKLKELKADVIHSHSPFLMGRLSLWAADKLIIPHVFTYHTLYEQYTHYFPGISGLLSYLISRYVKNYCSRSNLIITPSKFVKKKIDEKGISSPVSVVPTGINLEEYKKDSELDIRKKYDIGEKENIILSVGRLGKEKNIDFLLKVINKLSRSGKKVRMLIVGEGPQKENLKKMSEKLKLGEIVIFAGGCAPEEVFNYYKEADLLVFSSCSETQGLVLLEAMAAGLPVVAVDAGGVSTVVENGKNGFLLDRDIDSFAKVIKKVFANRKLYELVSKGARKTVEKYSMEKMVDIMLGHYRDIINGRDNP